MTKSTTVTDRVADEVKDVANIGDGAAGADGQEPVDQTAGVRHAGQNADADQAANPESIDDQLKEQRRLALQGALIWYVKSKFHWAITKAGNLRLSPNENYMAAILADAPEFVDYGGTLISDESTEASLIDEMVPECNAFLTSCSAIDDLERKAYIQYLIDRCVLNAHYAADVQFELEDWVASYAKQNRDARTHENYGVKEARRDKFALKSAIFRKVILLIGQADAEVPAKAFAKVSKQRIYQRADILTREHLNPSEEAEQDTKQVEAAKLAVRPF